MVVAAALISSSVASEESMDVDAKLRRLAELKRLLQESPPQGNYECPWVVEVEKLEKELGAPPDDHD
jgi:hypothetical protein